jgi:hypothetical protein
MKSIEAASICPRISHYVQACVRMQNTTDIDQDVDLTVPLLLEDTICRPDEIALSLQDVDLLERQVRLEEAALSKEIQGEAEVAEQAALVRRPKFGRPARPGGSRAQRWRCSVIEPKQEARNEGNERVLKRTQALD